MLHPTTSFCVVSFRALRNLPGNLGVRVDKSRCEIFPGVWLDWRRAAFLEEAGALVIADLHLGYAWAHRFNGQMLPLHGADRAAERISEMLSAYKPKRVVLLGDVLHQAAPIQAIEKEFRELVEVISASATLTLVRGNHDKQLAAFITKCELPVQVDESVRFGDVLLVHGDRPPGEAERFKLLMIGHEHPAISLGDGVSTSAKFPCFLVSDRLIILPAFSLYSSGTSYRSYPFMSALAQGASFRKAVAIMGRKLLPVPL